MALHQRLDRFTLTEEQLSLTVGVAPMQEQALRLGRDAPLARRQFAPLIDMRPDFIDENVFRLFAKRHFVLQATLSSGRDRDYIDALATASQFLAGGLTVAV